MESLAYLHLALAYETSEPSESGIQLEQMAKKGLKAEISNGSSSISSLPRTQLIQKWVPSLKLNFLIRVKPIALVLVLLLSSPVGAYLCRCGYVCEFHTSNGLVIHRKSGIHTRKSLKKSLRHRVYRQRNKGKVFRTSILKLGSKGEQVVELRYRLFTLDYLDYYNSNIFDAKTEEAVKKFQKDNSLKVDGIVGTKTNGALFEAIWPSSLSGRALFNRGLKQDSFFAALRDYNEAIRRDKNLAEAYYRRGMLYAYAGQFAGIKRDINKASNDFTKAIKINPDYIEAYLERGIIYTYHENRQLNKAVDNWNQVIIIDPDNIEAYYRRAQVKEKLKNNKSAINDYIEVITRKLKLEKDTFLGTQIEEAINNFKMNKSNEKLMLTLLRGIATAYVSNIFTRKEYDGTTGEKDSSTITIEGALYGDNDETRSALLAVNSLKEKINKDKNLDRNIYKNLLIYFQELNQYQYQLNRSKPISKSYFSASPFASASYYQGLEFLFNRDNIQAKKAFDEAIEKEPNLTKAYYLRGIIRSKQGDEQGAISDFKKYLQGDPEMEEAKKIMNYQYSTYIASEEREACFTQEIPKEYLETLESYGLKDASAYIRRGKLRFLLADYPGAKKDFQEAIKADPNLAADAYYQQGKVAAYEFYFLTEQETDQTDDKQVLKKAQEAKESFDEAIKRNPNLSEAYFERGYLKYQMKDTNHTTPTKTIDVAWIDDSQNDFEQAIKIDKNFAQAYYLMVVAEKYRVRIQAEQQTEQQTEDIKEYKLSPTEINNLTEAIRNDIYFYSDFIGRNRLTMKRAVCVELGNSKQDDTIKSVSIIQFKSKIEEIYYTRALGNYRKKEYKQAIENISQAIKLNPDISEFYLIRGAAYYFYKQNNENYKAALKDFKASIQLEPILTPLTPLSSPLAIPETTYSSSLSHFLIGRIIENQDIGQKKQDISQKEYRIALSYLPQADWILGGGAGGDQTQNTASSSSAQTPSGKCR